MLLFLTSCGYSIRSASSLPFHDISIVSISNATFEPNIEDILHRKLADEFIKQGIAVWNTSDYEMSGVIQQFTLKVVSEKNDFSSEYEVIIRGSFTISGPDGFRREFSSMQSPFIESFVAERGVNVIIALKEIATEQALESLARRLVSEVIYR